MAHNGLGELAPLEGEIADAAAHYREALLANARSDNERAARVTELNLALVLIAQGEFAEADAILARAGAFLVRRNRIALASAVSVSRLATAAGLGDWPAWDAHFARLVDHPPPIDPDTARVAEAAGQLCREVGDRARAWRALEIARRTWESLGRTDDLARCREAIAALGDAA